MNNKSKHPDLKNVKFEMPYFPDMNIPKGFLSKERSCHALFYYASLVRHQIYERDEKPREEHDQDPLQNPKQLFTSIATAYGVLPEQMVKWWTNVDMQFRLMGSGQKVRMVPEEFRFEKVPEMKTQ